MASSSRSRCSDDSDELSAEFNRFRCSDDSGELYREYNRLLYHGRYSRQTARQSSDQYKLTLVGSRASGAAIEGSDGDFLIEPRNIIIDESKLRYRHDLPCYVRISTEGLAGLIPSVLLGDGKYVRADPVRDMRAEIFGETKFSGFSGYSKVGNIHNERGNSTDIVPQLRISGKPHIVRSFAASDRSWPSDDNISLINTGEFHLTARPAPSCPDREHDFCLSFAKAEVVLLRTMYVNQILSIKLLKFIGRLIDFGRGALTSYHLKTSAFWYFEQTNARFWENDLSVMDILKRLDRYLKERFLPHYFVPEMNLLIGVSESDLIYVRRRLWSFLGLCLITDDIAGITPSTRLRLAYTIIDNVSRQLSEPNPASMWTSYMSNIGNILESAEVMYGTGIVSHNVMKQRISASVMMMRPIHVVRRQCVDLVKSLLTTFNDTVDIWVFSGQLDSDKYNEFVKFVSTIVSSTEEPLEEFFVRKSTSKNRDGGRVARRGMRKSENIMIKWVAFINDIIPKLQTNGNIVADQALRGTSSKSHGYSRVSSNRCEENIDRLLNKITKELLTFAVDHIDKFCCPLDNDTYSFRPVPVGDFNANLLILREVIERLILNVEYALVMSARIKVSRESGDQAGRIVQTMNRESLECRCFLGFPTVGKILDQFSSLCSASYSHHGWVEFMAATFRRQNCS